MSFDPEMFGQAMGEAIRKAVEPLNAKIATLEKDLVDMAAQLQSEVSAWVEAQPEKGDPGRDGKDCDMAAVKAMIDEAVKALPAPAAGKDGANGKDGASVTVGDLQPMMDEAVKQLRKDANEAISEPLRLAEAARDSICKALGDLRQPKDGKSVTLEDVRPMLADAVKGMQDEAAQKLDAAIKALPVPKDGRDGADGKDGQAGEKGADGAGIADLLTDRDGALVATFTDGRMKNLGVIVGKDGRDGVDGKDGADGLGLDAFELEYLSDTHEICVKATCAGRVKELRYPAGGIHGKGYWREGVKAAANEAWTHDGCMWIATKATAAKPEVSSPDWFLAARKGRDGERGAKGQDAVPPAPIKLKD